MNYFNEAMDSLLFLKNISSISFRMKSSTEPFWEVSSEKVNVPGDPRIKVLTIKGQLKTLLEELQCTCKEWYVISGSKNEEDIPTVSLEKIRKDRRLEARYGLAVPVSKTENFRGRNYMSLPLRKPDTMEIPAHVDAVRNICEHFQTCTTLIKHSVFPELSSPKQPTIHSTCRFRDGRGLRVE